MTVASSTARVSYAGNGSTTGFSVNFYFLADAHLQVILRAANGTETVQTLGVNYTVSGAGNPAGGTVTFGTAPASGVTVVIVRNVPLTQQTDYQANDPFPAESHETALDKLTMINQQLQDALTRSIKLSPTNTMTSTEFTVGAVDRANKILAFDSSGEIAVTQEIGTYRGNWASGTSYQQRDLIKDTSTDNIFICLVAHTSSGAQPITTNTDSAKWALIVDAATAKTAETNAATSATAAANSATAAATSATNAATSATNASNSATSAATSATNAGNSATAAASSATTASTAATNAGNSATAAATSATNASNSASAAATSATNASNSASAASTSATNAATSETNAASSASAASTSASNAATSATNASNSATAAATSATNAGNSATAAATSATNAAASFDQFDDIYLGAKSSNPATDNDGDPLQAGALYFNTVADEMRVYSGSAWAAAGSAINGTTARQTFTATAGQTTFTMTSSYDAGFADVYLNGVKLVNGVDVNVTSGTDVVLTVGAAAGDSVDVIAYGAFVLANHYTRAEADAQFLAQDDPRVAAIGQFSWDNNATTTPVAKPQVTPSSTLIQSIHARMRGCLLLDNGQVSYYLNPTDWAFKEDGSASVLTGADGMVMVEIPAFYVKNESSGTLWKPVISATPLPGYDLHPAFIKDGVAVPYRYYSAYDACVFDVSASAYISGTNLDNATSLVDTAADKLASVSGVYPMVGLTRNQFRLLAANRGTGWRMGDFTLWSAIGLLLAVEAQTLHSQGVYGAGNTGGTYLSSSSNQNDSPHTIAGAGNALGNGSTDTTSGAAVNAKPGTSYCKYRGIENFWGNAANWTDGINIFSEGNSAGNKVFAYWSNNRTNFADDTAANYGLLGEIANTLNQNRFGTKFDQNNVWGLVTTDFSTTSTHGTNDRYRTNSGWRVLPVGGAADSGGTAGAFDFRGTLDSSFRDRTIGARLAY